MVAIGAEVVTGVVTDSLIGSLFVPVTGTHVLGGSLGGSFEEVEGLRGFGDDGFRGLFEFVGDLEDAGGVGREGDDLAGYILPVDTQTA